MGHSRWKRLKTMYNIFLHRKEERKSLLFGPLWGIPETFKKQTDQLGLSGSLKFEWWTKYIAFPCFRQLQTPLATQWISHPAAGWKVRRKSLVSSPTSNQHKSRRRMQWPLKRVGKQASATKLLLELKGPFPSSSTETAHQRNLLANHCLHFSCCGSYDDLSSRSDLSET